MKYHTQTKDELIIKLAALQEKYDNLVCEHKTDKAESKIIEKNLLQKSNENSFLSQLSFQLAQNSEKELINDIALPAIKNITGATVAVFTRYDQKKQALLTSNIVTENSLLNKAIKVVGKKFFTTESPVGDTDLSRIMNNVVKISDSLTDLSFGEIPEIINSTVKKIFNVHHFMVFAQVNSGKLYGTTMLAFHKNQELPSVNLLTSYSNILAVSLFKKRAEHDLKASRAILKAIIENSLVNIWSIDTNYIVNYVNGVFENAFYNSFGVKLQTGINIIECLPNNLKPIWKKRYDRVLANEQFILIDKIELPDTNVYIEVSMNPIVVDGKVIGASLYGKDISEQKNTEIQLIAAKERAEESDRLKSAFLANMSHEIRTPMNGILGFAELLKTDGLPQEKQHQFIAIIEQSGRRMLNIINDLIDISKIESGQIKLHSSETNLNKQIGFLLNFFKTETDQKGIQLTANCPLSDMQVTILTDKEKMYAILTNLIKNAIKFTKEGSIEFGYKLHKNMLEIYVKDTGIGIPANQQQAVFDRFIQVDSRASSGYEGSGLGLAISKAYAKMMGGDIWLKSTENKGSTFYFSLPYTKTISTQIADNQNNSI